MEILLDHAMQEQIWISTDRAREVRIVAQGKSEVAIYRLMVYRLRHLREYESREAIECTLLLCTLEGRSDMSWFEDRTSEGRVTCIEYLSDLTLLLLGRSFVDAREKRYLLATTPLRDFFVREYHEFFDHHMGVVTLSLMDVLYISLGIEVEVALSHIKEYLPFLLSSLREDLVE